ncbi:MAG: hypothetical protein ACTH0E_02805 [Candidatus Microbacterium stercoravium]
MQFDARALTDPVERSEVRAHSQQLRSRFPRATRRGSSDVARVVVAVMMLVISVPMLVFGLLALLFIDGLVAFGLAFGCIGAGLAAAAIFLLVWNGSAPERHYRFDRFAAANGMSFHPGYDDPQLPGMLFDVGKQRYSEMLVRGEAPRFVEFGNYQYTTGSGKSQQTHTWGYIAVRLDAPLPNIVLDAEGNNSLFGSNLPVRLDKRQRLSFEGGFDTHFSLYCPTGYEADALYLFTPDIMQRFMNRAAQLDVEIVDDWLFFYSAAPLSTLDPARWAWQFSVVGAMLDKIARWGRWRDERLRTTSVAPVAGVQPALADPPQLRPPEGVAEPGRRLKRRRFTRIALAVGLVFIFIQAIGITLSVLS